RLFGVKQSQDTEETESAPELPKKAPETQTAMAPVAAPEPEPPVQPPPLPPVAEQGAVPTAVPIAEFVGVVSPTDDVVAATPVVEASPEAPLAAEANGPPELCQVCSSPRKGKQSYCDDCGWVFPADGAARATPRSEAAPVAAEPPPVPGASGWIKDRYQL